MTRNAATTGPRPRAKTILLLSGILLIACSLRAPIISIAPVLGLIQDSFGLTAAQAGLLTTLPLLAFAAVSPFSARFSRNYGLERSLFGALILIAAGIVLRSAGPVWCLYLGTWIAGSGIAVGNVLLPSLLKRDFPGKIAAITGAYAITMGVAAAAASALVVPLAQLPGSSWHWALGASIILPVVTLAVWLPQLREHVRPAAEVTAPMQGEPLWRSALAWQVTLFMGANSFLYYIVISWHPAILASAGFSIVEAGNLHGLMQLASAVPGFVLAPLMSRMKDQRAIAMGVSALMAASLLGLLLLPSWAALWSVCIGASAGAGFMLALMFMGLRARNAQQAAALSGMAQCVGYLLAATGPPIAGMLRDETGGWGIPLAGCVVLAIVMGVLGSLAGRARQVGVARSLAVDRHP